MRIIISKHPTRILCLHNRLKAFLVETCELILFAKSKIDLGTNSVLRGAFLLDSSADSGVIFREEDDPFSIVDEDPSPRWY